MFFIIEEAKRKNILDFSNFKFSNLQLNNLKPGIKNGTEVTLKISSNVIGDSIHEINFPHKLLLTNTQVLRLCKAFAKVHQII